MRRIPTGPTLPERRLYSFYLHYWPASNIVDLPTKVHVTVGFPVICGKSANADRTADTSHSCPESVAPLIR